MKFDKKFWIILSSVIILWVVLIFWKIDAFEFIEEEKAAFYAKIITVSGLAALFLSSTFRKMVLQFMEYRKVKKRVFELLKEILVVLFGFLLAYSFFYRTLVSIAFLINSEIGPQEQIVVKGRVHWSYCHFRQRKRDMSDFQFEFQDEQSKQIFHFDSYAGCKYQKGMYFEKKMNKGLLGIYYTEKD